MDRTGWQQAGKMFVSRECPEDTYDGGDASPSDGRDNMPCVWRSASHSLPGLTQRAQEQSDLGDSWRLCLGLTTPTSLSKPDPAECLICQHQSPMLTPDKAPSLGARPATCC